ncbi:MAG: 3-phosphoshikimate 1-carboxyvinyltransferase AroA [Bacteroidetes bacterium HLUCCA01]|nr:MAG: 3-phosphoshikimate 1-carboxyvinyltransferase AroA [Bacteroidetes bacterium HLUCCA01]
MKFVHGLTSLKGSVVMPPDKSIAHRAAMFASIADGVSVIENYALAADPQTTLSCFRQLGVSIEQSGTTVTIHGVGRDGLQKPEAPVDCGNSGTTARLLTGILSGAGISATLIGDDSLSSRTMRRIIGPLSAMGVSFEARDGDFLPMTIKPSGDRHLIPIRYELPIPSAQVKSCLLLAGLFGEQPTTVIEPVVSRDHTEKLLNLPVLLRDGAREIQTSRQTPIPLQSYAVPGDFSAAAFWLVAGSIYPGAEIVLENVGVNPTRTAAMDILRRMGADITLSNQRERVSEPVADITVRYVGLTATEILPEEVPNCIDELPALSVAMAFARGTSRFTGAGDLRHKESDRLAATAALLRGAGADFQEHPDGLVVHGNPDFRPISATYASLHDHRIAMSAAILAGRGKGKSGVKDASCTAISYPSFWDDLSVLSVL